MTDQPEVPQSPPTARDLLKGVDALMRRNRQTGTVPLPPPEGQVVSATPDEETQTLLTEIDAASEAVSSL
ncbi:MAG: hypothetical protein LBE15_02205, partial [Burkholderiales bacterium]|nr:hypothetical protein [Burkholderiales bacterium]